MDENNIDNLFGERLKELRAKNGISQKQMAEDIGISPSVLSAYENPKPGNTKNPTILTAIKIALHYEVSIDWLCGLSDKEKPSDVNMKYFSAAFSKLTEISKKIYCDIELDLIHEGQNAVALVFNNASMINFFNAWKKAKSLYDEKMIDENMYNDLLNGLYDRYDEVISEYDILVDRTEYPSFA